jgi:hypothetical protein
VAKLILGVGRKQHKSMMQGIVDRALIRLFHSANMDCYVVYLQCMKRGGEVNQRARGSQL